jgi:hypothetical protein
MLDTGVVVAMRSAVMPDGRETPLELKSKVRADMTGAAAGQPGARAPGA